MRKLGYNFCRKKRKKISPAGLGFEPGTRCVASRTLTPRPWRYWYEVMHQKNIYNRASSVLGWVTAWEHGVLLVLKFFSHSLFWFWTWYVDFSNFAWNFLEKSQKFLQKEVKIWIWSLGKLKFEIHVCRYLLPSYQYLEKPCKTSIFQNFLEKKNQILHQMPKFWLEKLICSFHSWKKDSKSTFLLKMSV